MLTGNLQGLGSSDEDEDEDADADADASLARFPSEELECDKGREAAGMGGGLCVCF